MTDKVIALRPVELSVSTEDCTSAMATAMMAPIFALAEKLRADFEANGMPKARYIHVTVHTSEALTAALQSEDAFDLIVEFNE